MRGKKASGEIYAGMCVKRGRWERQYMYMEDSEYSRLKFIPSHDLAALFDLCVSQTLGDISIKPIFGNWMRNIVPQKMEDRGSQLEWQRRASQ